MRLNSNSDGFTLIELPVRRGGRKGFTLIELLVVVTIMVVLMAILVPAVETAVDEARMTVCATNLKGIATGASTYAVGNNHYYPDRKAVLDNGNPDENVYRTFNLLRADAADDRLLVKDFIPMDAFLDPQSGKGQIKLDDRAAEDAAATRWVYSDYAIWFGFYHDGRGPSMNMMGKRWQRKNSGNSYTVLVSDPDVFTETGTPFYSMGSHTDNDRRMVLGVRNNSEGVLDSRWVSTTALRGEVDLNQAYLDGSTLRFNDVEWNEWGDFEPFRADEDWDKGTIRINPEGKK